MQKSQRSCGFSQQAGFTLLEVMIGLAILATILARFGPQLIRHADDMTDVVVADHQKLVGEKAREYIKENYNSVLAAAKPGAPAIITIQMLKNSGYWPVGMEERNAYGQIPRAIVRKTDANRLETAIITSEGEKIPERSLRSIATQAGLAGGFVSEEAPTVMQGARGSWSFPLSDYGVASGGGVLASSLVFQDGIQVDDYLYRNAVPNRSELNEMNTALGMRSNDINNIGQAFAKRVETTQDAKVGQTLTVGGNAVIAGETTTGGWFRNTGDNGWYNEKWGGGFYMEDPTWIRAKNDKSIYSGGEIAGGLVSANGRLKTGEYLQLDKQATEGAICEPNGLVGRTETGLLLSCQSGVWKSQSMKLLGKDVQQGAVSNLMTYKSTNEDGLAMYCRAYNQTINNDSLLVLNVQTNATSEVSNYSEIVASIYVQHALIAMNYQVATSTGGFTTSISASETVQAGQVPVEICVQSRAVKNWMTRYSISVLE